MFFVHYHLDLSAPGYKPLPMKRPALAHHLDMPIVADLDQLGLHANPPSYRARCPMIHTYVRPNPFFVRLEKIDQDRSRRDFEVVGHRPCRTHWVHYHTVERRAHVRRNRHFKRTSNPWFKSRFHGDTMALLALNRNPNPGTR